MRKRFLKNLEIRLDEFRIILDKNNIDSVNLYFQDESRFGLITKQKRVITPDFRTGTPKFRD